MCISSSLSLSVNDKVSWSDEIAHAGKPRSQDKRRQGLEIACLVG